MPPLPLAFRTTLVPPIAPLALMLPLAKMSVTPLGLVIEVKAKPLAPRPVM